MTDRRWQLAEAVALLALLAVMVRGFTGFLDLHPSDEVEYLRRGRELLRGEAGAGTLVWSPLYSATCGVADLLWPEGSPPVQDALLVLTRATSLLALWWSLRGIAGAGPAVFAAAFWTTADPFALVGIHPRCNVYLFAATLHFLAVGCLARGRCAAGLLLLAAAALDRTELTPWLLGASAAIAWRRSGGARRAALAGLCAGCALLLLLALSPGAADRAWLAFSQHFAVGASERAATDRPYAMDDHDAITRGSFPTAGSVRAAAVENPGAMLVHLAHNLAVLPYVLGGSLLAPVAHAPALRAGVVSLLGLLVLAGCWRSLRGPRAGAPLDPDLVLRSSLLCLLPCFLLRPRSDLLLPVLIAATAVVARLAARGCPARIAAGRPWLPAIAVLSCACLLPRPFADGEKRAMALRESAAASASLLPGAGHTAFGTWAAALRVLADRQGPSAGLRAADPAASRAGDVLILHDDDPARHGAALQRWSEALGSGEWRLVHAGLSCWWFERR